MNEKWYFSGHLESFIGDLPIEIEKYSKFNVPGIKTACVPQRAPLNSFNLAAVTIIEASGSFPDANRTRPKIWPRANLRSPDAKRMRSQILPAGKITAPFGVRTRNGRGQIFWPQGSGAQIFRVKRHFFPACSRGGSFFYTHNCKSFRNHRSD